VLYKCNKLLLLLLLVFLGVFLHLTALVRIQIFIALILNVQTYNVKCVITLDDLS